MAKDRPNYQRPAKTPAGPKGSISQYAEMTPEQAAGIANAMKGKGSGPTTKIAVHRQSNLARSNQGR